jgi:hypothetical protein
MHQASTVCTKTRRVSKVNIHYSASEGSFEDYCMYCIAVGKALLWVITIVERSLQDSSREHNLVFDGSVVGVDGGRCHAPSGIQNETCAQENIKTENDSRVIVRFLSQLFQVFLKTKLDAAQIVFKVFLLVDNQLSIFFVQFSGVENVRWETNFVHHGIRLQTFSSHK